MFSLLLQWQVFYSQIISFKPWPFSQSASFQNKLSLQKQDFLNIFRQTQSFGKKCFHVPPNMISNAIPSSIAPVNALNH